MVGCYSVLEIRQRNLFSNSQSCRARPVMVRAGGSNISPPVDTSGKIPDSVKVPATQAAPPDSRQSGSPSSAAPAAPAKRKGSWTPPYPSLVNTKPLPTEDVKTNIDM
ncbi:hypothetical protein Vretimale_18985 [Volvox reticuliferus]|uniref:Uncharacterized protein n=1 Tax=Volvox reticuliferus TaxID=1737510 RepID=A0A8J4GYC4_9CHLO|nr:hypothetical protein Vretifemale_20086 [Volvox reticuliferus]GIM16355.1 hypothetical protein Vretimale_18985 [Volvox reticuliferus]